MHEPNLRIIFEMDRVLFASKILRNNAILFAVLYVTVVECFIIALMLLEIKYIELGFEYLLSDQIANN